MALKTGSSKIFKKVIRGAVKGRSKSGVFGALRQKPSFGGIKFAFLRLSKSATQKSASESNRVGFATIKRRASLLSSNKNKLG